MTNKIDQQAETKFWMHPEGWIYVGDKIEGARAATQEEIDTHMGQFADQAE
ncbi:hypothetical protein RSJ44_003696 [Yersinia enterocolitica]|uniref:hypothetical protein n=1 Tax=Yersinia enterocolitica TaxID=630 RepID=UPI0021E9AA3E|nr:hypothetical protein [Yersinia enterocolitica]EKN3946594.1 hypothetical protein [Yersinia enterocolitica]EKN3978880.1 hypothetical protein [Yersinia enterocolitica]ELI8406988.1 hypothetical protein [Yersinia enterocolitica]UYJ99107.1 hypothetical protein N4W06_08665 [Yersinia enterocolitica]